MHILILGGTLFLGRHLVEACLARGHRVTLFHRGTTGPALFPEVVRLRGDRDGDLSALAGNRWDAVIDTSGYVPRIVDRSAALLAKETSFYAFVSSASVYADLGQPVIHETAAVATLDDPTTEAISEHYGALKALCEERVEAHFPSRALHVRAGLIFGPHDATGRLEYWIRRIGERGEVLAPGRPDRTIQLIHARDLADWIVTMVEGSRAGTYNVTGPQQRLTMAELLDACNARTGGNATFTWVDEPFLLAHDVKPFSDLPLWLPESLNGLLSLDISRALATGLAFRPLATLVDDTLRWLDDERETGDPRPAKLASGVATRAGLDRDRERELLEAWHARVLSSPAP